MTLTLPIRKIEANDSYPKSLAIPTFDPHDIHRHQVDAHWGLFDGEATTARCSLWWRDTPIYGGDERAGYSHQVGLIGHFAAANDEAATTLLDHACGELASQGCTLAVGPLDGNTWRDYRLVTESDQEPAFFLEPQNHFASPDQFRSCGFSDLAFYFSAITDDLRLKSERVQRIRCELADRGIQLRPLSDRHFEADLGQIHNVAHQAFQNNLMYQDIGADEFIEQYQPLRNEVPFDLILVAEQQGRAVGFVFAVPDFNQSQRGLPIDTAIVKTARSIARPRVRRLGPTAAGRSSAASGRSRIQPRHTCHGPRIGTFAKDQPALCRTLPAICSFCQGTQRMNIAEILQAHAEDHPEDVAIIDVQHGLSRETTYRDFEHKVGQTVSLFKRAGLQSGDTALVFYKMSAELYVALAAILRLGMQAMFVDPSSGRRHIERCCQLLPPQALIAGSKVHLLRLISPAIRRIPIRFSIGGMVPFAHVTGAGLSTGI